MNNITRLDHSEAIKLWLVARRLIFFCGSAVSLFPPTCLPTGYELSQTCIQSLKKALFQHRLPQSDLKDLLKLPLETLIGLIVEDITKPKHSGTVREISKYFQEVSPNEIHFLIASFLLYQNDRHVITTNYDLGIENAIKQMEKNGGFISSIDTVGFERLHTISAVGRNTIFKIHGCASLDHPQNLVLTTRQESKGLPPSFVSMLESLFQDSLVVFLGYSLSEPDCLEALMNVSNYDVIWVVKSLEKFKKNRDPKIEIILKQARNAYLLEDLFPFSIGSWDTLCPSLSKYGFKLIQTQDLHLSSTDIAKKKNSGLKLFQQLTEVTEKEGLFRILISAYLQLKEIGEANQYLIQYNSLIDYSPFLYYFWSASSKREHGNWKEARDTFQITTGLEGISEHQRFTALIEQLGLDTLLSQNDDPALIRIENKMSDLILSAKKHLSFHEDDPKLEWLSILGKLQKNVIQNISYQSIATSDKLIKCLTICDEAISNLRESRTIQSRIEVERFKGRIHFRLFKATGEIQHLDHAFMTTEKSLRLFSLLEVKMGEINAKRQYVHYLLEKNLIIKAGQEIEELKRLVADTPDRLSKIKANLLASLYYFRSKKYARLIFSLIRSFLTSIKPSQKGSTFSNIKNILKWYSDFLKGKAG